MTPPALKAILFDWDGTLLDSAEATYRCYGELFASYSLPFDRESFERTYCPDWYRTYEAMGLPREVWPAADRRWLDLYAQHPAHLLPEARAALDRLRRARIPIGLVTSGQRERVAADLARLELPPFDALVCGSDLPERKPHPAPLMRGLDALGIAPAQAAYIGDSPDDIHMAQAAGVFAVAVPGGYPNRQELAAAGADLFTESLTLALTSLGAP
jgi:phosphoglycolate phosphatase